MNPELQLALGTDAERYAALFRISEVLSACGEPEHLARVLANQSRGLISFDHLDVLIFKENFSELEWHEWGTEPAAFPDLPVEETSSWHVYNTHELRAQTKAFERRTVLPFTGSAILCFRKVVSWIANQSIYSNPSERFDD